MYWSTGVLRKTPLLGLLLEQATEFAFRKPIEWPEPKLCFCVLVTRERRRS